MRTIQKVLLIFVIFFWPISNLYAAGALHLRAGDEWNYGSSVFVPDFFLVLAELPSGGWRFELASDSWWSMSTLHRPFSIDLNRKLSPSVWEGETVAQFQLENGIQCSFPITMQIQPAQEKGAEFQVSLTWPSAGLYAIAEKCSDLKIQSFQVTLIRHSGG